MRRIPRCTSLDLIQRTMPSSAPCLRRSPLLCVRACERQSALTHCALPCGWAVFEDGILVFSFMTNVLFRDFYVTRKLTTSWASHEPPQLGGFLPANKKVLRGTLSPQSKISRSVCETTNKMWWFQLQKINKMFVSSSADTLWIFIFILYLFIWSGFLERLC